MSDHNKHVVWDESNLQENKQYFEAHPVTRHIDEPKTPYEPEKAMDEEGNFVNSEDEAHKVEKNPRQYDYQGNVITSVSEDVSWDEETKSFARRARAAAPVVSGSSNVLSFDTTNNHANDKDSSPDQSEFKKRRIQQSLALSPPSEAERVAKEEAQHHAEFEHMRKAVYADEGAKFKEQLRLAKQQAAEEEEE